MHQNNGKYYNTKLFRNFSSNIGIGTSANNKVTANAILSATWRAPNINELYTDGLHHGAARIEKGDSNLVAEKAYAIHVNTNYKTSNIFL